MVRNAFRRENCLFNCAILGLMLLSVCSIGLLLANLGRSWENERTYREQRSALTSQRKAWQQQQISTYRVAYSNCNGMFCCQREPLYVTEDAITDLPTCANNSYGVYQDYYGPWSAYNYVSTMDQTYQWLDDWMEQNRDQLVIVEYDPDLHYITRIQLTPWEGATPIVIEYRDLAPNSP